MINLESWGRNMMDKAFILDVQFDDGAAVRRKTVACMAPDRATATKMVKKAMENSADEVATVLSIREMVPGDVVVID